MAPAALRTLPSLCHWRHHLSPCRFGRLLECLRAPLARRGHAMGELVGFDFGSWLELAERHHLDALKSYCLVSWSWHAV